RCLVTSISVKRVAQMLSLHAALQRSDGRATFAWLESEFGTDRVAGGGARDSRPAVSAAQQPQEQEHGQSEYERRRVQWNTAATRAGTGTGDSAGQPGSEDQPDGSGSPEGDPVQAWHERE